MFDNQPLHKLTVQSVFLKGSTNMKNTSLKLSAESQIAQIKDVLNQSSTRTRHIKAFKEFVKKYNLTMTDVLTMTSVNSIKDQLNEFGLWYIVDISRKAYVNAPARWKRGAGDEYPGNFTYQTRICEHAITGGFMTIQQCLVILSNAASWKW